MNNEGDNCFQYLLKHKSSRRTGKNGSRTVKPGLSAIDFYKVQFLVREGIDLNWINKSGENCLHLAVAAQDVKLCGFLLEHKVDINCINENDETPLIIALKHL